MLRFFKQYATYGIGIAVNRLTSLLLLPIYTRVLTPADYGVLDFLMTIVGLLQPFFLLGIDTSVQILFFKSENEQKRNELVSTTIFFAATFAAIFAIILVFFFPTLIHKLIGRNQIQTKVVPFLCFYMWLVSLFRLFQNNFRLLNQPLLYNGIAFARIVLMGTFSIFFVVIQEQGVLGIIIGMVLADLSVTTISGILVLKRHFQIPNLKHLLPLLKLGLPLLPTSAAYWVLRSSDRFFLAHLSTMDEVGLYGIASRLASGIGIFTLAVQLGWRPFALGQQKTPQSGQFYATIPIYYFMAVGWIGLVLATLSPLLINLFATEAYREAVLLITPLILAQVVYGAYYIFSTGTEIVQRTYHLTWTIALAAIANTALNILLIPDFGALGASIATAISYGLATISVGFVSYKLYPIPYKFKRLFATAIIFILGYTFTTIIYLKYSDDTAIILNTCCVVLFGCIFGCFLRHELHLIFRYSYGWIKNKIS